MNIGITIGIPFQSKARRILAKDDFNRADNVSSLGNADTGQTWQQLLGIWGISGNNVNLSTTADPSLVVIDSLFSNGLVSAQLKNMVAVKQIGLVFRLTDTSNYLRIVVDPTSLTLFKRVAGALTTLATYTRTMVSGDVVGIELKGPNISTIVNGNVIGIVTDSFNQTATKHGLCTGISDPSMRWDNFKMEV